MVRKKIAVIGAGISGLSISQMLKDSNCEVIVFERNKISGGLISCDLVNNVLFHKVGGHVFNSKNKEVLDWYWSRFDKNDFHQIKRVAKIFMSDQILGYPIENYIHSFNEKAIKSIVIELLSIYSKNQTVANNFDEFLRNNFGDTLYNIYFKPYNEKIWKTDLSTIPLEWLDGKLPMPNIPEILISNILCKEESEMVHSNFWYPLHGGSQFIADRLSDGLNIRYEQVIENIDFINGKWIIKGEAFDQVVYTGDVRMLESTLTNEIFPESLKFNLKELKSNGTSNLLCEVDSNDFSWMYFPEEKYKIHRIIYTGNFAESNNGSCGRKTCTIEYSGHLSEQELNMEIDKLPGNLNVLSYNYEPNSYIYHTHDTPRIVREIKEHLEVKSFHLVGRFAEWEYYNMDKAIEAAMSTAEKILNQ
jgi:protoporphyrinogen oxidase